MRRVCPSGVIGRMVLERAGCRDDPRLGMTETSPLGTLARRKSKLWHMDANPSQLTQNSCKAGLFDAGA